MRILCLVCILVLSLCALAYVVLKPHDHVIDDSWSDENTLKLTLEVIERPTSDLGQTKLRLTAKNIGPKPIVLDSECLCGFRFHFEITGRDPNSEGNGRVLLHEDKRLPKPAADVARSRFGPVQPGQAISRSWRLSGPIRMIVEGHATDLQRVHHGYFYEAEGHYEIPP